MLCAPLCYPIALEGKSLSWSQVRSGDDTTPLGVYCARHSKNCIICFCCCLGSSWRWIQSIDSKEVQRGWDLVPWLFPVENGPIACAQHSETTSPWHPALTPGTSQWEFHDGRCDRELLHCKEWEGWEEWEWEEEWEVWK